MRGAPGSFVKLDQEEADDLRAGALRRGAAFLAEAEAASAWLRDHGQHEQADEIDALAAELAASLALNGEPAWTDATRPGAPPAPRFRHPDPFDRWL